MKKSPPAFQFYASDFLAGTMHFTPAEVGTYIRLLCHQWAMGKLPADPLKLRRLAGGKVSDNVLAKFFPFEKDFIRNERLEAVRKEKASHSEKQSEIAKLRWIKGHADANALPEACQSDADAYAKPMPKVCSPSPSPSPSTNTPKVNQSITPAQEACAGAEEEQRFEDGEEPETHPAIVGPTGLPPSNDPDELEPDFDVEPPKGMPRTAADAFRRTPIDLQESLGKDVVATIWEELASTGWRNRHGLLVTSWGAHIKTVGPLVKRHIIREKTAGKGLPAKMTSAPKSVGELLAERVIREANERK